MTKHGFHFCFSCDNGIEKGSIFFDWIKRSVKKGYDIVFIYII